MLIRIKGNAGQRRVRREARNRIIRMEFWTFLNSLMLLPAQVIRSSRRRIFRLLTYRPTVDLLLTIAFPPPEPLTGDALKIWQAERRWSSNRLPHTKGTEVRKRYGLEAAQVILGHSAANITEIYAERDAEKGREVAREMG